MPVAILLFLFGVLAVKAQKPAPQLFDYIPASEPLLDAFLEV